jgi:hypothetical protein
MRSRINACTSLALISATPFPCRSGESFANSTCDAPALRQRFDRFVRVLGRSPENPDKRKTAGDCRYQGDCRDGFHGAKSDRERALPTVPKVIESTGRV